MEYNDENSVTYRICHLVAETKFVERKGVESRADVRLVAKTMD